MTEPFYLQGIHYDAMFPHTEDIEFYKEVVQQSGSPVLELACGTGRVTIPLAKAGFQVTGLDNSESMLERARAKAIPKVEFILGDMRDFSLDQKFQTILLPFNALGLLHSVNDVVQCLNCVQEHLDQDGQFIISMYNPDLNLLFRSPNETREGFRYLDPESDDEVVISESNIYDRATQLNTIHWHYTIGTRQFETQLKLRVFFPQELEALLSFCGFAVQEKFGDFDRTPFLSDSPQQILIVTKVSQ